MAFEMEQFECSVLHAGSSSFDVWQFREQLNELKKVGSRVHRWEQRFDELSGILPSPQIVKENFISMHTDLLMRFVEISKMPSDPAVGGFVFGSSSHMLSVDMNTLLQSTDDFDFADMNNNFHHLKCLSDHLFLCESRLA